MIAIEHLAAPLLRYGEVAEILQMSKRTVRRLCLEGQLVLTYVGTGHRTPRITPESVRDYIDRRVFPVTTRTSSKAASTT